jgi:hypothetical protein
MAAGTNLLVCDAQGSTNELGFLRRKVSKILHFSKKAKLAAVI